MRNIDSQRFISQKLLSLVENLPYFTIENLKSAEKNEDYLRIILSRYSKAGEVVRLKKGLYTTQKFIDYLQKRGNFSAYLEFMANTIYQPSYLSLEYVLYKNNILTEAPVNFTSVSKNKTIKFSNKLGNFIYHKIKDNLFVGYKIKNVYKFSIYEASLAKAFFDYLYLRKRIIINKKSANELRLNLSNLTSADKKELKKYINLEGSKIMKTIFNYLFG